MVVFEKMSFKFTSNFVNYGKWIWQLKLQLRGKALQAAE